MRKPVSTMTFQGLATIKVPTAVPTMITNSHGCISTARCPPMAANPPSNAAIVMMIPTRLTNASLHCRFYCGYLVGDACAKLASRSPAPRKLFPAVWSDVATAAKGARVMLSTIADYQRISKDMTRSLSLTARKPDVSRETAYYLANIGKITNIDDFLKDYRLFSYAMKAHGLSDMTYAKAFMRKVLTEGVSNSNSFANKLSDTRYREFAQTFNFELLGSRATQTSAAQNGTATQFVQQTMEENAGEQNEGVRLALYFTRKAASIKGPFQILADKALTQVVQTALGLSPNISAADIDKQAAMLSKLDQFFRLSGSGKGQPLRAALCGDVGCQPGQQRQHEQPCADPDRRSRRRRGLDSDMLTKLQTLRFGR